MTTTDCRHDRVDSSAVIAIFRQEEDAGDYSSRQIARTSPSRTEIARSQFAHSGRLCPVSSGATDFTSIAIIATVPAIPGFQSELWRPLKPDLT